MNIVPKPDETQAAFITRAVSGGVAEFAAHAHWRNFQRCGHIHGTRVEFASLRGVEIFAVGTWNGRKFTLAQLEGIVASFEALSLSGRIPLKFGHEPDHNADGAPALGWVDRIWIDGDRLMADFKDMPKVVYDAISEGLYKFVSVELLRDVPADTRVIPWVLDAVALLGATAPAVGILADLKALTMARSTGLQCEARVTFRRDTETTPPHGGTTMTEQEERDLREQLRVANEARQAAEREATTAKEAQATFAKEQKAEKVRNRRAAITGLFNKAVEDKRIDPKVREQFASLTQYEADEAACERVTDEQVTGYIESMAKGPAKKADHKRGDGAGSGGEGGDDPYKDMTADQEVNARAVKFCRDNNQDPQDYDQLLAATQQVLRNDKELAERYKYDATDRFAGRRE